MENNKKTDSKASVVIAIIGAVATITAAYIGRESGKSKIISSIVNEAGGSIIINEMGNAESDANAIAVQLKQNQEQIDKLQRENNSLLDSNESLSQLQQENSQLSKNLSQLQQENTQLAENLQNEQQKSQDLQRQITSVPSIEYKGIKAYLDGAEVTGVENPMALINGKTFYNEDLIKQIFGHYNTGFELAGDSLYVGKKIILETLPLSKAEVFDMHSGISINSGQRKDFNGNEFSGVLINGYSSGSRIGVTFSTNKSYNRLTGRICISDTTSTEASGKIEISVTMDDSNSKEYTPIYTSETFTKITDPIPFTIDIGDAKLVKICLIQNNFITPVAFDVVIADAYFYNE